MTERELKHLIALTLIPHIGSITARKLIAYKGSAEAVFRDNYKSLQKIPGIGKFLSKQKDTPGLLDVAGKELAFILKNHIQVLTLYCKDYPERLRQCEDAPLIIYYRGEILFNRKHIISVVGTRRATEYGIEQCNRIIRDLAEFDPDLVVVSGLAYGIDYQAHMSALNCGLKTMAVLAHGLHTIYPFEHNRMALKIIENGALVTDFASSQNPERNNFIKRNRIIAGLADAVLVVESGLSGGALITADLAGSYNRDVFAIPGRSGDELSAGCNQLIKRNKAGLIESAEDIKYFLGWEQKNSAANPVQRTLFTELTDEENAIVSIFKKDEKLSVDIISLRTNFPVSIVSAVLLNLEFKGIVKVFPGNSYKVVT